MPEQTTTEDVVKPDLLEIDLSKDNIKGEKDKIDDSTATDNLSSYILETSKLKQPLSAQPTYTPEDFYGQFAHYNDALWVNINNTWRDISNGGKSLVRAYRNGDQTIGSGSNTKVEFNAESFDITSNFNTSTYVFTAPRTAKYEVSCTLYTSQTTTGDLVIITANINGSGTPYSQKVMYGNGANESYHYEDIIPLTAGQTLEIQYNQSSGAPQTINSGANNSWVTIKEI